MHEVMQISMHFNDIRAGTQHKMKGVAKNNLSAQAFQLLRRHRLDGTVSPHRHEGWRLDSSALEGQSAASRSPFRIKKFKFHDIYQGLVLGNSLTQNS